MYLYWIQLKGILLSCFTCMRKFTDRLVYSGMQLKLIQPLKFFENPIKHILISITGAQLGHNDFRIFACRSSRNNSEHRRSML